MADTVIIPTNEFQTAITQELLDKYPEEVQEWFMDYIDTVPLLKWMIGERPRAKDLPRDEQGRIIVDIAHPHILENMDYFRPAIRAYRENGGQYSLLRPNSNPNSEYGKWFYEEIRRCREGYVRESDGEWVTGQMYFFLNYAPIMISEKSKKTGIVHRVEGFPAMWEGLYYRFHYIYQARKQGKHCVELARRGAGKSFCLAGIMAHNLILGEDEEAHEKVTTVLTAYTKEYLSQKDGTFTKFTPIIDFCAANTEFPRLMLTRRAGDMIWVMGYKNSNGNESGSLNSVMGLSVKDDEGKVRGKRGFILFEEMGNYPNFKDVWDNVRDSVKNGEDVFSLLYAVGTAGDDESDFAGIRTILYKPDAYEVLALENVYDRRGKGAAKFAYFFPSYISREGCMDKDGNSDVVKALLQILNERYMVKQGDVKAGQASTSNAAATVELTPKQTRDRIIALILVFAVVIFFWMAFHQNGSSLTYFARDYTQPFVTGPLKVGFNIWALALIAVSIYTLFGAFQSETSKAKSICGVVTILLWGGAYLLYRGMDDPRPILPQEFQQFNPFFVVALTPVSMAIFGALAKKDKEPSAPKKIGLGMLVAALGYAVMLLASAGQPTPSSLNGAVSPDPVVPTYLINTYLVLTFAELLLSPMGISFVSKVAPPKYKGLMMGCWFAATAIGNYLSSIPSMLWDRVPLWLNWTILMALCLIAALIMFAMLRKIEAATQD